MGKHLISIIVPVYNISECIEGCIKSILNQSYSNIEIILVDDGSTDGSGSICDKYKEIDSRVVVLHKENGGLSDARNKGLEIAKGDYIGFVDGDDVIHKDMYNILLRQLLLYDADISICRFQKFTDKDKNSISNSINNTVYDFNNVTYKCVDNEYALKQCLSTKKFSVSAWSKLYKKAIFNNIRFPKGYEMEDWAIIVDIMLNSRCIVLVDELLYYYYQRHNGIMHGNFKESDLKLEHIFIRNLDLINKYFPKLYNQSKTNLTANYFYVIDKMIKSRMIEKYSNEFDDILLKLNKEFTFIIFKSKHRLTRKILYIILSINRNLYIKLINYLT